MTATVPTDLGVISHLYSSLIVRAPDLKVHPAAAASWKATGDTAWRFTLRDGLTFPIAWGVILHLHGDDPLFDLADRYPIDAVNWHARETAPSLASGHARTRRGVVGGIARMGPVAAGSAAEVDAEARDAIDQAGGRRLVVAPGCVIPTTAPEENLLALRRAVES